MGVIDQLLSFDTIPGKAALAFCTGVVLSIVVGRQRLYFNQLSEVDGYSSVIGSTINFLITRIIGTIAKILYATGGIVLILYFALPETSPLY